jgi:hypothetical protein
MFFIQKLRKTTPYSSSTASSGPADGRRLRREGDVRSSQAAHLKGVGKKGTNALDRTTDARKRKGEELSSGDVTSTSKKHEKDDGLPRIAAGAEKRKRGEAAPVRLKLISKCFCRDSEIFSIQRTATRGFCRRSHRFQRHTLTRFSWKKAESLNRRECR